MTEYTKTPPTEPGDYWFKQKIDGKVFAMNIFQFRGQLRCSWGTNPQRSIESLVLDGCVEVGPRIEFPKPVPGEVLDDIKWLRSVMVAHEECTGPMIYATPTSIARFKRICDYIDPPQAEPLPDVTIPGDVWAGIRECVRGLRRCNSDTYRQPMLDKLNGLLEKKP